MDKKIVSETENAVIECTLNDIKELLNNYPNRFDSKQIEHILNHIDTSKGNPIEISPENSYFSYILIELIPKNKISVKCKPCQKTYHPNQLQELPLGKGKLPVNPYSKPTISRLKTLFKRTKKISTGFGGIRFLCPNGHELISVITWIS